MNSWHYFWGNSLTDLNGASFAIFRTKFTPFYAQQNEGGKLVFKAVTGKAEVWLDKKLIAVKTTMASADIVADVAPDPSGMERTISVLIETEKGIKAGLEGSVEMKPKE